MAFRVEKRAIACIGGLLLAPVLLAQQEFRYEVRHRHSRPPHMSRNGEHGTLLVTGTGVSFQETSEDGKAPKHPHAWLWDYQDIQQLKIEPKSLTVLTYKDNKWKFGADREYSFDLAAGKTFDDVYPFLKSRLDQRFVAAIPDGSVNALWEIPVKHLAGFGGDEGVLQVGTGAIVYKSAEKEQSRTWRYQDVENISSSGPFQLTITTFERAKTQYGSLRGFNFQLKQPLGENRYNDLWLRLNQSKGLKILSLYREGAAGR